MLKKYDDDSCGGPPDILKIIEIWRRSDERSGIRSAPLQPNSAAAIGAFTRTYARSRWAQLLDPTCRWHVCGAVKRAGVLRLCGRTWGSGLLWWRWGVRTMLDLYLVYWTAVVRYEPLSLDVPCIPYRGAVTAIIMLFTGNSHSRALIEQNLTVWKRVDPKHFDVWPSVSIYAKGKALPVSTVLELYFKTLDKCANSKYYDCITAPNLKSCVKWKWKWLLHKGFCWVNVTALLLRCTSIEL